MCKKRHLLFCSIKYRFSWNLFNKSVAQDFSLKPKNIKTFFNLFYNTTNHQRGTIFISYSLAKTETSKTFLSHFCLFTHTHTHTYILSLSHTHTQKYTLSLSLSLSQTHPLYHIHNHTHTHTHTRALAFLTIADCQILKVWFIVDGLSINFRPSKSATARECIPVQFEQDEVFLLMTLTRMTCVFCKANLQFGKHFVK